MPQKAKNKSISQDLLVETLNQKIESGYKGLLGTINQGVNQLFYAIGAIINDDLKSLTFITNAGILNAVDESLKPIFGSFLSFENLALMRRFANSCDTEDKKHAASILNWRYIPYFLELKGDEEWVFYVELIYNESLTPATLSERISTDSFKQSKANLGLNKKEFWSAKADSVYRTSYRFYFRGEDADSFQTLFKPVESQQVFLAHSSETNGVYHQTISSIYKRILEFQSACHHELNTQFNLIHWEIGAEIVRFSSWTGMSLDNLIKYCIEKLHTTFPALFKLSELNHSIRLVHQYGENNIAPMELIQNVSWPYLKLILDLESAEKQTYAAYLALNNDISFQDLKEMISQGSILEPNEEQLKRALNKKSVSKVTSIEKNFITRGTMETIEPNINPDSDLNRNIFKNPEFLEFLAKFD